MFGDYYRHLLVPKVHEHFPQMDNAIRMTIENNQSFCSVIREHNMNFRIDSDLLREMERNFKDYLKRRSGSIKNSIVPCSGTIGRWNKRRSMVPIMELSYQCYDTIYYQNWINSELLDRLVWSNIIPILVTDSFCPHGAKNGIIFIID